MYFRETMNNALLEIGSKYYTGHTYPPRWFIVYPKFKHNQASCILSGNCMEAKMISLWMASLAASPGPPLISSFSFSSTRSDGSLDPCSILKCFSDLSFSLLHWCSWLRYALILCCLWDCVHFVNCPLYLYTRSLILSCPRFPKWPYKTQICSCHSSLWRHPGATHCQRLLHTHFPCRLWKAPASGCSRCTSHGQSLILSLLPSSSPTARALVHPSRRHHVLALARTLVAAWPKVSSSS